MLTQKCKMRRFLRSLYHVIVIVLVSHISNNSFHVKGQVVFNTSYKGANSLITANNTGIKCSAFGSCMNSEIESDGCIECYGSHSCYNATSIISNGRTDEDIGCYGLYSCAHVSHFESNDPSVDCYGELSCFGSSITTNNDGTSLAWFYCAGDHSCANTTIHSVGIWEIDFNGHLSGSHATLIGGSPTVPSRVDYYFYDANSGYMANILCHNESTCYIRCHGNGCTNLLSVGCVEGGNKCYSFDCHEADYSVWCPDGYKISDQFEAMISNNEINNITMSDLIPFNDHDLLDIHGTSDWSNSYQSCSNRLMLYEPNCDDFRECFPNHMSMSISMGIAVNDSNSSWIWNSETMCCTGAESCWAIDEIRVSVNTPQEFSIIDKTSGRAALRCDGYGTCPYSPSITIDIDGNVCVSLFNFSIFWC